MASENLLRYIWETQILPQAGYSFSRLHSAGYSLIALQEMNLASKFPQIYWNTASLSINAGANEDNEDNKGTNYGKVASAIGNMKARGIDVTLPDINKADFGFKPDVENNAIIFGMKGINGINDDIVRLIIDNRPFHSLNDFLHRMYRTGLIKKKQMIQLIKGGCFDSLDTFNDRKDIMKEFFKFIVEPKTKLTMSNLPMLIENDLIPEDMQIYVRYFKYKQYVTKKTYKIIDKAKDKLYLLDDISTQFFNEHFTDDCVVDTYNGQLVISDKKFKKQYDKHMEPMKEWVTSEEPLHKLNERLLHNEWEDQCPGTLSKWEMDSLSMYYHEHELAHVDKEKYGIVNFFEQPEEPVATRPYTWKGRQMYEYQTYRIAGTVLDKDKTKHTVTVLTNDGVVTVKLYAGKFSYYNKQISRKNGDKKEVLEKSWFTRGQLILLTGFRRENNFIPKTYKNSIYQHSISLIDGIYHNGNLSLITERVQE